MPDTNYDKFNLVVSTLFLNKWYLKKSTFFENDPYRSLPSIKIVFYLLTAVNLYNIHIQINKYTMSAIEI